MSAPSPAPIEKAEPTNLSRKVVVEIAEKLAAKLNYQTSADLEGIVEKLGGEIQYGSWNQGDNGGSLEVFPGGTPRFVIRLYGFIGNLRNRFTIAHELGHYFLHSDMGAKRIQVNRAGSDRLEWEANWFAGAFLLPEARFRKDWVRLGRCVEQVAAEYQVSEPVVEIRLKTLGMQ